MDPERLLPIASNSSIKIIQGAFFFACSNKSLTLAAPAPTKSSTNSEPEIIKKGTSASPATAFERRVFPVPGGPTKRTPFGILAPISVYLSGFFKKSTISVNSSLASSTPATSENVTLDSSSGTYTLALLLVKLRAP